MVFGSPSAGLRWKYHLFLRNMLPRSKGKIARSRITMQRGQKMGCSVNDAIMALPSMGFGSPSANAAAIEFGEDIAGTRNGNHSHSILQQNNHYKSLVV